jgi:hypothetical protein
VIDLLSINTWWNEKTCPMLVYLRLYWVYACIHKVHGCCCGVFSAIS